MDLRILNIKVVQLAALNWLIQLSSLTYEEAIEPR